MKRIFYAFFIFALSAVGSSAFFLYTAHAQTSSSGGVDSSITPLPGETPAQTQTRLKAALAAVEAEQQQAENDLKTTKAQSASLTRDISVLNGQIKIAELNIKAKNLLIATLGKNINQKQQNINELNAKIQVGKATLTQLIQKTNEIDAVSLPEIILSGKNLTDVYTDIDTFASTEAALKTTFEQIRADEAQNLNEKNQLTTQQNSQIDAKQAIVADQVKIQAAENQKAALLKTSKNSEKTYAQVLAKKQAAAASIRAALFTLAGGSSAIPFGDALKYATTASVKTGVRPAFLLAILTQESALGANVGSCLVTDLATGNGVGKNTGSPFEQVMKAPRDTTPFVSITSALGLNWATIPVSCPIGSARYYVGRGFGGAMGPAQFIPSTWLLFQSRISIALNKSVALVSPWNPQDAFMASALYLGDLGALNGSYTGETKAACSYFGTGGKTCAYGKQVQAKANTIQTTMIDPLQGL
ncbi:MAG: hypothetical protein WCQ60_01105 [bacterium]